MKDAPEPSIEEKDLQTWNELTANIKKLPPTDTQSNSFSLKKKKCHCEKPSVALAEEGDAAILADIVGFNNRPNKDNPPSKNKSLFNATANIDRSTLKKFQTQQFKIEAQLDLHGHTETQAYNAVFKFIKFSYTQGKRCILIITGKGLLKSKKMSLRGGEAPRACPERSRGMAISADSHEEYFWHKKTLKDQVPTWLNSDSLTPYILSFIHPAPTLGGSGALYILLRRNKE